MRQGRFIAEVKEYLKQLDTSANVAINYSQDVSTESYLIYTVIEDEDFISNNLTYIVKLILKILLLHLVCKFKKLSNGGYQTKKESKKKQD